MVCAVMVCAVMVCAMMVCAVIDVAAVGCLYWCHPLQYGDDATSAV
jgi:hypothetical protein